MGQILRSNSGRKIASFLWEEEHGNPAPENPIMRRRDRVWDNPYTKTLAQDSAIELQRLGKLISPLRT